MSRPLEFLEEQLHRMRQTMLGQGAGPSWPALEELEYRLSNEVPQGPGFRPSTFAPEDLLSAAADALTPGVPMAGIVKPIKEGAKDYISDWLWKPAQEVEQELALKALPEHVHPFGDFMQEMVDRAGGGTMSPRDLIKSYTITRSSIRRQGRSKDLVPEELRWAANKDGQIRPEDAFAAWLLEPAGKRYLDAAERGVVNEEAISEAVKAMGKFGLTNDLKQAMRWAAENLPGRHTRQADIIARGGAGDPVRNEFFDALSDYYGIGASKSGFYGSMLGYGDLPTLDARQLQLHTPDPGSLSKYEKRGGYMGGAQAVNRLAERQEAMNLAMPERYEPFRQHLTHHAVWDKAAGEQTTHEALMRAMRAAGLGGMGLLGALSYVDPQTNYELGL